MENAELGMDALFILHSTFCLQTLSSRMLFKEVIGQQAVKDRLMKSAAEGRISHALLFLGAEGWGSLALTLAFAQYLVCEKTSSLNYLDISDACGHCHACLKMNKLVHPDVTFTYPVIPTEDFKKPRSVDFVQTWRKVVLADPYLNFNDWVEELNIANKQGIISVHESADILHRLSLKAVEAPYKIVIIWMAEKMNEEAANKLLKIIEEPPDQTLFFLVAENYELIIPTILSRTQLVKLNRLRDDELAEALVERHSISKDAAQKLSQQAEGNYREAMNLIEHHDEEQNLNQQFLEWMRACLKFNLPKLTELTEELLPIGREKQKMFFQNGLHILRQCLMINYADHSMIQFQGEELESFKRFAPFVNRNNAEKFVEEFNNACFHLERNANFKILFTDLSLITGKLLQT